MVYERLEAARNLPENQNPLRQSEIISAVKMLRTVGVVDPGPLFPELNLGQELSPEKRANLLRKKFRELHSMPGFKLPYYLLDLDKDLFLDKEETVISALGFTNSEKLRIEDLGLSTRSQNVLRRNIDRNNRNVSVDLLLPLLRTAGAVSMFRSQELATLRHSGITSVREIEEKLKEHGLTLATEE